MRERRNVWSGGWWRFSKYEIGKGAIKPARSAEFKRYDPWEIYRESEWNTAVSRPYQSLMRLVVSLGAVFDERSVTWRLPDKRFEEGSLTSNEQIEVLDWCARFGLLGILPHIAVTIQLPLRFAPRLDRGLHFERELARVNGRWIRRISAVCTPEVARNHVVPRSLRKDLRKDLTLLNDDDPVLGRLVRKNDRHYRGSVSVAPSGGAILAAPHRATAPLVDGCQRARR
jgi:hypothetical protein